MEITGANDQPIKDRTPPAPGWVWLAQGYQRDKGWVYIGNGSEKWSHRLMIRLDASGYYLIQRRNLRRDWVTVAQEYATADSIALVAQQLIG